MRTCRRRSIGRCGWRRSPRLVVVGLIGWAVTATDWGNATVVVGIVLDTMAAAIFTDYALPFEILSLLLLVAHHRRHLPARRRKTTSGANRLMGLQGYLVVSALLFGIGCFGFLARRNAILMLISIELMLNAVNLSLVAFNAYAYTPDDTGAIFSLLVMAVAAAEATVGLALVIAIIRTRQTPRSTSTRTSRNEPMTVELLIALIPALPLAGFLFAVLSAAPRPRPATATTDGTGMPTTMAPSATAASARRPRRGADDRPSAAFRPRRSRQRRARTAGHADDLANGEGAAGVIPEDMNDGLGQPGHVTPGGERPALPLVDRADRAVGLTWLLSMSSSRASSSAATSTR
jgi:NADH-quinone oxidoreductase subunit K